MGLRHAAGVSAHKKHRQYPDNICRLSVSYFFNTDNDYFVFSYVLTPHIPQQNTDRYSYANPLGLKFI